MSEPAINVESLGHLSARCGVPLGRVMKAAEALGIHPAMVVDDVAHLATDDAQRVAEAIAGGQRDRLRAKARRIR